MLVVLLTKIEPSTLILFFLLGTFSVKVR
ncbi:PEP-CTERM sorting domain-containing protein [Neptunomonas marina]|uniref:PEP-CTERM sorting domain-containing protein n=1 Tax=Neptunomonas marina TaxID=1815562 RepID=A0A437QBB1_9GAMM|nr:PEP-CTERM sorting domain-containing protein [Neptunomonas marina]